MKAIRRRQWEIRCGNGEQTADSWMWTGFTKSCRDPEDYICDYSGHQMGEEVQQGGGLRWRARGHIERTEMCNDSNRSLLPGLSVLEWNCCVCVSLHWAVHYFFRFFMCHLSVVICSLLRDSQVLLKAAEPGRLPVMNCGLHTHTQAAEPRTRRDHEGLWTRREDGL